MDPREILQSDSDQFLKFEDVKERYSERSDLNGLIILDKLCPTGSGFAFPSAEYEKIWLSFDADEAFSNMTEETAWDLLRCGILYDEDYDAFYIIT